MFVEKEILDNNSLPVSDNNNKISIESLAQEWAKKYLQNLQIETSNQKSPTGKQDLSEILSPEGRKMTAQKILSSLRSVSAQAWNKTEALLSVELQQHRLDPNIINPWEIAGDSFNIYQKALEIYTQPVNSLEPQTLSLDNEQFTPNHLARMISPEIGVMRKKYTNLDPRIIGYVSMQFHYTSQMLIEQLESVERSLISAYFKIIDDHLYMPLQRAYEAAANHDYNSLVMSAVRELLPVSTQISQKICQKIVELFPSYRSLSGILSDPNVKISSIRDVEMFQVYLWVCALEGNIVAIQEELFPLCIMLYPRLKVDWDLIRQMLHLLSYEIRDHLTIEQANTLMPYFLALSQMFSSEVLD